MGQVYYTPWCDAAGKVVDDGTLSRLDEATYRLTSADSSLRWLHMNAVGHGRRDRRRLRSSVATLALKGRSRARSWPSCRRSISRSSSTSASPAPPIRDIPVSISRTGYTGDLGYEIWVEADRALPLWDALIEGGTPYGITPAGVWALDIARIEAGLIMLDVDYYSAHHALIETAQVVAVRDQPGLGRERDEGTVQRPEAPRRRARARRVVGIRRARDRLELVRALVRGASTCRRRSPNVPWRVERARLRRRQQVGYATSGCWSPLLKKPLALAHLDAPAFRGRDSGRDRGHGRAPAPARAKPSVRELPFYEPERKKA